MRQSAIFYMLLVISIGYLFQACGYTPIPKPSGYYRIDLPQKVTYASFDQSYPYSFLFSDFATIEKIADTEVDKHWINIHYPKLNCRIYVSYKPLNKNLQAISEDSRQFVFKHTVKADAIDEQYFYFPHHQSAGIIYTITGDAASPLQFVVTDSVNHFLRGALYFNCAPNADSLKPMVEFVTADVHKLIESIRWNNAN